ncbi:hypothetical protein [Fodinicola feengrottensis]|uniref:hypothetical protein n=1 Tax=Fodinicola feengrottensis TaxID=435914 RepID=UPI0013D85CA8|nr:hypothetical protein [Fodinicola feengrottensis]
MVAPTSGARFAPTGHWVYNVAKQTAFHVDGATGQVDAGIDVQSEPGTQVVQTDTDGYVVGHSKVVQFGKSNLRVSSTTAAPAAEEPLAIEATGGSYLIYRSSGKIVRLGASAQVVTVGDAIGDPVIGRDGTMWMLHTGSGLLCELPKTAVSTTTCPGHLPAGHGGALTTVAAASPRVLDTTAGTLYPLGAHGLGTGRPLGVPTSAATRLSPADANGRLPLLDPTGRTLYLVDPDRPAQPIQVPLGAGRYAGPLSSGPLVAMVDVTSGTLVTYDNQGHRKDAKPIPASDGMPTMTSGADGRVYVQNGAGTHLLVVGKDGTISDAPVIGTPAPTGSPQPSSPPQTPAPPLSSTPPPVPPRTSPQPPTEPGPPTIQAPPPQGGRRRRCRQPCPARHPASPRPRVPGRRRCAGVPRSRTVRRSAHMS